MPSLLSSFVSSNILGPRSRDPARRIFNFIRLTSTVQQKHKVSRKLLRIIRDARNVDCDIDSEPLTPKEALTETPAAPTSPSEPEVSHSAVLTSSASSPAPPNAAAAVRKGPQALPAKQSKPSGGSLGSTGGQPGTRNWPVVRELLQHSFQVLEERRSETLEVLNDPPLRLPESERPSATAALKQEPTPGLDPESEPEPRPGPKPNVTVPRIPKDHPPHTLTESPAVHDEEQKGSDDFRGISGSVLGMAVDKI